MGEFLRAGGAPGWAPREAGGVGLVAGRGGVVGVEVAFGGGGGRGDGGHFCRVGEGARGHAGRGTGRRGSREWGSQLCDRCCLEELCAAVVAFWED